MTRFLTDILVFYVCALSPEPGATAHDDAMRCAAAFETAKQHFYTAEPAPIGTLEYGRQSGEARRAFLRWEMQNRQKVQDLQVLALAMEAGLAS